MYSHSKIETFNQCPFKYFMRYKDPRKVIQDLEPSNPLIIGSALHKGLEKGKAEAKKLYYESFNIIDDRHVNEWLKIENNIDKWEKEKIEGQHEVKIFTQNYIGFVDLVDEYGNIYDFKYTNNIENYKDSRQLSLYKYYGNFKGKLYYIFFPKYFIRQKKSETLQQFRLRLEEAFTQTEITVVEQNYDYSKVQAFKDDINRLKKTHVFSKTPNKFCKWCEYYNYCQKGDDSDMILPKNEKRKIDEPKFMKVWIYGNAFTGKTTFASKFPEVLMLNTDGNIKFVDSPYIYIRDEVKQEGRLTKRIFAWQKFKEAIEELEKQNNDFKTIVVDLVEDLYEACRLYMYDKLNITHESDDSFRAWDKVKQEFLTVMKNLLNLDYNIVLISHEDDTKDITQRGGDKITSIRPNLREKIAFKIAGMVDIVARVHSDGTTRKLSFKNDDVIFGGGRLNLKTTEIPLDFDKFKELY